MSQENEQNPQTASNPQEAAPEQQPAEAAPEQADRVAELEAEVAGLKDQVLRALAETENVRRRLEQQAEDRSKYAVANFAKDMLNVADNLRRALDAIPADKAEDEAVKSFASGVELTERELLNTFERYGIKQVAAQGERFNPNLHQAMMEVPDTSVPQGTVVLVMQSGYTLHDRLLRPAMVGVSKGGPKPTAGEGDQRVDTTV